MMATTAPPSTLKPRGRLISNANMARFSSWQAGGSAELLFIPADLEDLRGFLAAGDYPLPLTIIGLGSNLLVRDGGIDGTVCRLATGLDQLTLTHAGLVMAQAGVAAPKLARFANQNNLAGAEFFAGIPGSVGGALAMNAGCYGTESWSFVKRVTLLQPDGELVQLSPDDFVIGYRSVVAHKFATPIFIAGYFQFNQDDGKSKQSTEQLLKQRADSQPIGTANAGSVFANPPSDSAGRLLDDVGMRKVNCGGAVVSDKHANFIINQDNATAADIENLIELMRKTVYAKHGIELKTEVKIIGRQS